MIDNGTDGVPGTAPPTATLPNASKRAEQPGKGTMRRTPDRPCLNCGNAAHARYCPSCGQAKRRVLVSVGAMIADVLEDQLVLSKALPRTLLYVLVRPGFLTYEYVNGRIVRYVAPFRLYLVTSVVFFILLSFFGLRALDRVNIGGEQVAQSAPSSLAAGLSALEQIDTAGMPADAREAVTLAIREVSEQVDADLTGTTGVDRLAAARTWSGLQPWAVTMLQSMGASGQGSAAAGPGGYVWQWLERIAGRFGHLPPRQAIREFTREYFEYAPHTVFVLLPIFALILKLLYIRRGRYYAEHFVFALHVHAFVFLVFILMFLIRNGTVNAWLFLGIMLYLWLAMKRVYGQDWFRTTVKYFLLGSAYSMLLSFAMLVPAVVALLLA